MGRGQQRSVRRLAEELRLAVLHERIARLAGRPGNRCLLVIRHGRHASDARRNRVHGRGGVQCDRGRCVGVVDRNEIAVLCPQFAGGRGVGLRHEFNRAAKRTAPRGFGERERGRSRLCGAGVSDVQAAAAAEVGVVHFHGHEIGYRVAGAVNGKRGAAIEAGHEKFHDVAQQSGAVVRRARRRHGVERKTQEHHAPAAVEAGSRIFEADGLARAVKEDGCCQLVRCKRVGHVSGDAKQIFDTTRVHVFRVIQRHIDAAADGVIRHADGRRHVVRIVVHDVVLNVQQPEARRGEAAFFKSREQFHRSDEQ